MRAATAAILLAAALGFVPRAAHADEAIARRLAALKVLVVPGAARSVRPAPAGAPGCRGAAWQATDYGRRSRTEQAIRDASLRFGVDTALIRSVIRQESAGDPHAVSHKGAMGLMQLMPATARSLGVVCAFDPRENVLGGTRYLRQLRDDLGSWPRAVAAYHAGPRRVRSGRIPGESRRYAKRVLRGWKPRRFAVVDFD